MKLNQILKRIITFIIVLEILFSFGCREKIPDDLPNILWLTSEDNSAFLGSYGDEFATTPNLDRLATEGFLYTHAYANAPVCAPTRNTIITGVYASSNGNQHMRSYYTKSEKVKTYPELLREIGYYCTNNSKTDYNTSSIDQNKIWDESSNKAHYKNRAPGQPFFAVFNTMISHESSIHNSIPNEELRHKPENVILPPYHPDTPEMRHDWAQYYDKVEDMDTQIGSWLDELEQEGLAENTIVFYYADHGGVLARSKRYVYETGTHVPFIVRIPEKYKYLFPEDEPGLKVNRLISFVDLMPTLLSIAGIEIPDYLQGNAFLGEQKTEDPEYAFMFRGRMDERYDMSRAVRDNKYRYIRNYMPYRIYGQYLEYLWRAPSIGSWEQAYKSGKCNEEQSVFWEPKPAEELYDTENDPWEVNNLAADPAYRDVLMRMRSANKNWMLRIFDTGFIPEADFIERAGEIPFYDYMRSEDVNLEKLIEAADVATIGDPENLDLLVSYLGREESAIRYWGATGLLILGDDALPAKEYLEVALTDESANVVVVAAEALYKLGEIEKGKQALLGVLENKNAYARCFALNSIDEIGDSSSQIIEGVISMVNNFPETDLNSYDINTARGLIEKWGIDEGETDKVFDW